MSTTVQKVAQRKRRHGRIRSRVSGTSARPRLSVFRSNSFLYAQLINDETQVTICGGDTRKIAGDRPLDRAVALGGRISEMAKAKGVTEVVFDRGGFLYTGAVRAFADAARAGGLTF